MNVSDLKPGMTAIFGDVECPITDVRPDGDQTRVGLDTPNGPGWMILPNEATAPPTKGG